jgi:hypothetical protein
MSTHYAPEASMLRRCFIPFCAFAAFLVAVALFMFHETVNLRLPHSQDERRRTFGASYAAFGQPGG